MTGIQSLKNIYAFYSPSNFIWRYFSKENSQMLMDVEVIASLFVIAKYHSNPIFPYTSTPAVLLLLLSTTDSIGHHCNHFLVNMLHSPSLLFSLIPSYRPTPAVVIITNVCLALTLDTHCSQCLACINLFSCINWHLPASSISDPEEKFYHIKDQYDDRVRILLSPSSLLTLHKEFTCFVCSPILSKLHPFHPPSCF